MIDEMPRRAYLRSLRRNIDNMQRDAITKKIMTDCRKVKYCQYCGGVNGTVKKVAGHALKVIHERYRWYINSTAKSKVAPASKIAYDESFEEAKKGNNDIEKHVKKAVDDMNPLRVLNLFRRITANDCELLGMNPDAARPEALIWQYVPAPPVSIRPSVAQEGASTEDDITNKLGDIIQISSIIRAGIDKGQPVQTIMEQWDYLQIQVAMYINADVPNLQQAGFGKPIRGFCQRLKGKQGRFRGNLSGKRVDFSSRTVISPDANLSIEEICVPDRVAVTMTYPERVTQYNIAKLRMCVKRGKKHPGANAVVKKSNKRRLNLAVFYKTGKERLDQIAEQLQIGDVVERHLEDGDIVLFNRQPSLHKLSIMSHRAKVREWRTFRLNECVCTPYNADFDGDEMNMHLPQTEEARTEAIELMGVKHNICTPKDGTPIIAATQDFITAAYLLSNKDRFYDRKTFAQICNYMFHADAVRDPVKKRYSDEVSERQGFLDIDLPEPTVYKPERLWTGKQVFNVLMRPSRKSKVLVNMDAACKEYRATPGQAPDLSETDTWLCIRNSEVMCGVMDKATLGSGKKGSIFYVILRDFGPDCAVNAMNRLSRLSARWLANEGFSIGINDVYPGQILEQEKQVLVEKSYAKCDDIIQQYNKGTLRRDAGCDEEKTMENKISGELSSVRAAAGAICFANLSPWNSAVIMAKSGSKGSNINVSQMVAGVGQQMIGGARVADGFQDRTLPHFPKAARQPPAKGFVRNSFFSGLTPTEFIFHAMSGREGLVDTAVKTAETGYMSRRLMKSLEDLSAQYDNTVRNGSSGVVQFQFGDDHLDPVDMEGKAKPVHFERTYKHAQTVKWKNEDKSLLPFQINDKVKEELEKRRKLLVRKSLRDAELPYKLRELVEVDQLESQRDFLDEIEEFLGQKADDLARVREHLGMQGGKKNDKKTDWSAVAKEAKQLQLADGVAKLSQKSLDKFLKLCLTKYERAKTQPGHAVGAVGAQSIGEPGTQMTLKTFHFAGVAGMSITQGVPRIKEIINASKVISTPVIRCELYAQDNVEAARLVKGRIEKTYLRDVSAIPLLTTFLYLLFVLQVTKYVEECWTDRKCHLRLKIDFNTINALQLDVNMIEIGRALVKTRGLALDASCINIAGPYMNVALDPDPDAKKGRKTTTKASEEEPFIRLQNLKRLLPDVIIKGYPDALRAIIAKKIGNYPKGKEPNELLVEGYGLKACMTTVGVDGYKTRSNNVMEMNSVLGIEAARFTIIAELDAVMGAQMDIDPRHMALLADVMTYKGDVLGITRFGLAKMRDSVLQLASFEKTPDHLFDAAVKGKKDLIEGVSECIIMGQSMTIGTGAMKVVRALKLDEQVCERKGTVFEELWAESTKGKRKA